MQGGALPDEDADPAMAFNDMDALMAKHFGGENAGEGAPAFAALPAPEEAVAAAAAAEEPEARLLPFEKASPQQSLVNALSCSRTACQKVDLPLARASKNAAVHLIH